MAGIAGVVGPSEGAAFTTGVSLLVHHESFEAVSIVDAPACRLAVVQQRASPVGHAWQPHGGVGVVVYGSPLYEERTGVVPAAEVLTSYLDEGLRSITELDGGFTVVVLDLRMRRLLIVNDRMATHSVQYASTGTSFAFAPEAKSVLRTLELSPKLSVQGCAEYLTRGFALADHTLFAGVHLLPPGSVLTASLDDAGFDVEPYWSLQFAPDPALRSKRESMARVHEVLRACVERAAYSQSDGYDLLLTGGLDARAVLAMGHSVGRPPTRTLTWGVDDRIPHSDPLIARQLADMHGVPHEFLKYDHDGFAEHAKRWTFISELGSDNLGNFAAGPDFLFRQGSPATAVFNGDQLLGFGGLPMTLEDAIEVGAGIPATGPAPGISAVFGRHGGEVAEMVRRSVGTLLEARAAGPLKDVADFLGWHTHGIRWLNAPMYHREPMVSAWRPLAHNPALRLFQALPDAMRIDKLLLPALLKRHHPDTARVPVATANSLVDWNRAFTVEEPTHNYVASVARRYRVLDSPLGRFVQPEVYRAAVEAYLATSFAPVSREPSVDAGVRVIRRMFAGSRWASHMVQRGQRWVNAVRQRRVGASTARVVQRLVLLELLLEAIDDGWFDSGPNASSTLSTAISGTIWSVEAGGRI